MGFLDEIKGKGDELKNKASDLASGHGEQIGQGIDKAAEIADKVTGGKLTDQIVSAAEKAKGLTEDL